MTLDIPDTAQFTCESLLVPNEYTNGHTTRPMNLCFRHAVKYAVNDHNIHVQLTDEWCRCDECDKERKGKS